MALSQARILSRPCEVHWNGFISDTFKLQQEGWELAVEENIRDGRLRILMKNSQLSLYALSDYCRHHYSGSSLFDPPTLRFHIVQCAVTLKVAAEAFTNFRVIDAKPQFVDSPLVDIEDLRIFSTPLVRTEEILVEPEDVYMMLEKIKKMQSPEQEAIRKRNAQRDAVPKQMFHAQILSFG